MGGPSYVEDICLGIALVDTDHVSEARAAAAGRDYWPKTNVCWIYLARDQRLLEKFGRGLCRFGIFGSGLTSVEEVDALIKFLGVDMPCGYLGR